jgi:hypothetical protein
MMRKILILLVIAYASFIAYANLRFENPSAQLEPVDVATFTVDSIATDEASALQKMLIDHPNITAASVNAAGGIIGLTYHFEKMTMDELEKTVSVNGKYSIKEKVFASSGGKCPVHGAFEFWDKALAFHRFVNN